MGSQETRARIRNLRLSMAQLDLDDPQWPLLTTEHAKCESQLAQEVKAENAAAISDATSRLAALIHAELESVGVEGLIGEPLERLEFYCLDNQDGTKQLNVIINPKTEKRAAKAPSPANGRDGKGRRRNVRLEQQGRNWALGQIRQSAPSLTIHTKKNFTANGKQGILAVSTTPSGNKHAYWFGVGQKLLASGRPTLIVAVLADKSIAFIVPYDQHKAIFDGLSHDRLNEKKFQIQEESGAFYLIGKSAQARIPLACYLNAFSMFR